MDDEEYFTVVFKGNLRQFPGNALKVETPFGVPVAVGLGDAFRQIDKLEAEIDRLAD